MIPPPPDVIAVDKLDYPHEPICLGFTIMFQEHFPKTFIPFVSQMPYTRVTPYTIVSIIGRTVLAERYGRQRHP